MNTLDNFSNWMKQNTTLSSSSIYKYSRAINTIASEMLEHGVITKSLLNMSLIELDVSILKIIRNPYFVNKNKTGNNMYSNSLKQFRYFIGVTCESNEEEYIANSIQKRLDIVETEKEAIIKARIGQGPFRKTLLTKYNNKCIITGIDNSKLLIASHIKPWSICDNKSRVDAENGLLLSANFDRLFDSGLITFSHSGKMYVSSHVGQENEKRLGITSAIIVDLKATKTLLNNMEYHRDVLFVK